MPVNIKEQEVRLGVLKKAAHGGGLTGLKPVAVFLFL